MRLFLVGDRVSQQQYGPGTVAAANEYHTTVDFDEHGSRTFATSIVKLERSSTVAPPRVKATRKTSAKSKAARA